MRVIVLLSCPASLDSRPHIGYDRTFSVGQSGYLGCAEPCRASVGGRLSRISCRITVGLDTLGTTEHTIVATKF